MCRHRHDGPGAVFHQDVIRDPDRDRFTRRGIAGIRAEKDPGLRLFARHPPRDDVHALRVATVRAHRATLLVRGERVHERVLWSEHHVCGAEDRIGTRGKDRDLQARRCLEHELRPLATADPVSLQGAGRVRPIEPVEVLEQPLGVFADREEPLLQVPQLDLRVGMALAIAVDHLLVGHDAHVLGAPVDGRLLAEREPRLEELQENPLRPLVVARIGRRELVPPVEHPAEPPQLPTERLDILGDELARMRADRQRVVFRMDAERVETDRLEHVVPAEPLESAVDVGAGEREHVAHVQPFGRRVREHHEVVERSIGPVDVGLVAVLARPPLLPLGLDGRRIVVRHLGHKYMKLNRLASPGNPA